MINEEERTSRIITALEKIYPAAPCGLRYEGEPWKLLVMAILSAQCTDKRVNTVSESLFAKYPTVRALAECNISDLEETVKSCGLYKTKSKNIRGTCTEIAERFGGRVPDDIGSLLALPGVGRKIANLILGDVYGIPAIVADTHCIRISARLGLTPGCENDPLKTEKILSRVVPPEKQADFCHRLVLFGRETCSARSPKCGVCPLAQYCPSAGTCSNETARQHKDT